MSLSDMPGPLCVMPDDAIWRAQVVVNNVAYAGKRQDKTPLSVSGVRDTRGFLSWIRVFCQSGLTAQIKGEKIMLVTRTADGFRATVSALQYLDGNSTCARTESYMSSLSHRIFCVHFSLL